MARRIVTALEVKPTEGEQAAVPRRTTSHIGAREAYVQGLEASRSVTS